MAASMSAGIGRVPSADIAVPDHRSVTSFYAQVLTTGERPLWRDDLLNSRGTAVVGVGERVFDLAGLPLQWMPHIQVADVGASAARAGALGGRELMHHKDEDGESRWAVLVDPTGAAFGIIPVHDTASAPPSDAGRIAWLDLTVPDAPALRDFYCDVVGWTVQEVDMNDAQGAYADYALCAADGTAVSGVCHARGVNLGLPPVWLLYLPVGDIRTSLDRVVEGGGEVVRVRENRSGEVAYAVIRDPVGACLALVPG